MCWRTLVLVGWLFVVPRGAVAAGPVVGWGAGPPTSASEVSAGGFHSCAIENGTRLVFCWGDTGPGQSTPPGSILVEIDPFPGIIPRRTERFTFTARSVAAGGAHSCAIERITRRVLCWGRSSSVRALRRCPSASRR